MGISRERPSAVSGRESGIYSPRLPEHLVRGSGAMPGLCAAPTWLSGAILTVSPRSIVAGRPLVMRPI
jgi:hypothetical protein